MKCVHFIINAVGKNVSEEHDLMGHQWPAGAAPEGPAVPLSVGGQEEKEGGFSGSEDRPGERDTLWLPEFLGGLALAL